MDPISNADRLELLLRQKLEERARVQHAQRPPAKPGTQEAAPASGIHALATVDWTDERALRRAIIQNLLADQLGPELINDAQFQQIVSRVTNAIEEDAAAAELLTGVASELRRP
jgi:hypothetical protein